MPLTAADVLQRYHQVLEKFPHAERRHAQEVMIREVSQALIDQKHLAIEAGTGSGKSFGYLIPALLLGKRPIVISTATIALQEQLINKDLPNLIEAMEIVDHQGNPPPEGQSIKEGQSTKIKLVKGRGNYLCIQKLIETERHIQPASTAGNKDYMILNYIKSEWQNEWDGDVGTLDMIIPHHIWSEIRSDSEDCLGRKCQYFMDNPYRLAREDLEEADIIVVNHALYLQDLMAGKSLLPDHEVVIFDEAHQIKSYALGALTVRIGRYATTKLLQKIQRRLQPIPDHYIQLVSDTEAGLLEWLMKHKQETFRLYPDDLFHYLVDRQLEALKDLERWLNGVDVQQLQIVTSDLEADKAAVHKNNLLSQLHGLILRWEYFLTENNAVELAGPRFGEPSGELPSQEISRVNWVELQRDKLYFELRSTPLDVAPVLASKLWAEKTTISTSATLSVNHSLSFFKSDLGLPDSANESILPSPFDYSTQCLLYLPAGMPDPNSPDYLRHCGEEIERLLKISQGRAFVLLTSYQAMKHISEALIPRLPFPCRLQGEMPRQRLIDWFKQTPNSVVFATATFWEGIDIPGDALSCVIIDKVPFAPPGDPVNSAMVDYIKAKALKSMGLGEKAQDWFNGFVLPQAIIKLKQGFGRLIRSKDDTGIVAILDPRISSKGYGRMILRSLPPAPVFKTLDSLEAAFEALEKDGIMVPY
ncbi:MAG: ATP-dependent DNA helicase [Vampirovibrionales bacterium]|nr:ATP-dependent DNA helicase [Vampirovibrionales bacterium]